MTCPSCEHPVEGTPRRNGRSGRYDLAIVGGTRLYNDARGTLTIIRTTSAPRPIREQLYFRLAG